MEAARYRVAFLVLAQLTNTPMTDNALSCYPVSWQNDPQPDQI